jgi:alpha-beta hydrolase superfamily lysophospholipase
MERLKRWLLRAVKVAVVMAVTVVVIRALDARRLPDLRTWHRETPESELQAGELDGMSLPDYLRREDAVFREVREIEGRIEPEERTLGNRYFSGSAVNPGRFARDWNRSFEVVPEEVRGGALLIHGLTDAPYSVRPLAEVFRRQGFYVLALRMPGHGTVPGGLTRASWKDWLAAVRLGMRHVRGRVGEGRPLMLAGYSNGGALAVKYSLDALAEEDLPRADRLVLLSPMIGVTRFAKFSRLSDLIGSLPGLEKAQWTDVVQEFNPFKYNSFPVYAAQQSYELTTALDEQLEEERRTGRIAKLPPVLTFLSLADATVLVEAVSERLYDRLTAANGSELVLFDLNRQAYLRPLLRPTLDAWLAARQKGPARPYKFSLVTNATPATPEVVLRSRAAGTGKASARPLGLSWPPQIYSLSHVALPFPVTDPLYGISPDPRELYGARLGALAPRGERKVLAVPVESLMRMSCNPFYPYMEGRVEEWIGSPGLASEFHGSN